jgi:isocitrate/isopropylmalate dehydrogenase
MSGHDHAVVFLAGHGIGPEVTAEASRALEAAARLHGFAVDGQHVPFGTDAFMRFGHPYPGSSRRAVLAADAVLVGPGGEALDPLEAELDLRSSVSRVRFDDRHDVSVFAPLDDQSWTWTVARAVAAARHGRAQVSFVGVDERWSAEAEAMCDGLSVHHLTASAAMRSLVEAPDAFDVVVCPPELAVALPEVAACTARRRIAAWGRLAESGPSIFGAGLDPEHAVAGQGVADPSPLLLAVTLLLGEGLGERAAGTALASALGRAEVATRPPSTRGLADRVLAQLPLGRGVEFFPEAV